MGTVFQHLPKISEETIYSITLFKKSNKISKMKAFILCCALFFIECVNGAPGLWTLGDAKRSDALRNDHHHHGHHEQREGNLVQEGQEHLANRAGPQEREVVEEKRMEERVEERMQERMQERAQERIQERAQERMQERAQERMQERFLAHKRIDEEAARWDPALPRMALLLIKNDNRPGPIANALKKNFGDEPKENAGGDEAKNEVQMRAKI